MLKPEQYIAIEYLAQPGHGGLTQEEIAQKCGVSRMTLYKWRKDPKFQDELRRQIAVNTMNRLPEVIDAMVDSAIKHKSSNAAKLIMQACGMLKDHSVVEVREEKKIKTEELKAEIERFKARMKSEE